MKCNLSTIIVFNLDGLTDCHKVERVLFLGLDGAGSLHTKTNTPNINELLKAGVYCDYGTAMDPTTSGENWGSILHGVIPIKHKLDNIAAALKPYHEDSSYPSVFKIIHQNGPNAKISSFSLWPVINNGIIKLSRPMHRVTEPSDGDLIDDTIDYLKVNETAFKFLFCQFVDIDNTGHSSRWLSTKHKERYTKTDGYTKQILEFLFYYTN